MAALTCCLPFPGVDPSFLPCQDKALTGPKRKVNGTRCGILATAFLWTEKICWKWVPEVKHARELF